jgi:hypothetical protein
MTRVIENTYDLGAEKTITKESKTKRRNQFLLKTFKETLAGGVSKKEASALRQTSFKRLIEIISWRYKDLFR